MAEENWTQGDFFHPAPWLVERPALALRSPGTSAVEKDGKKGVNGRKGLRMKSKPRGSVKGERERGVERQETARRRWDTVRWNHQTNSMCPTIEQWMRTNTEKFVRN